MEGVISLNFRPVAKKPLSMNPSCKQCLIWGKPAFSNCWPPSNRRWQLEFPSALRGRRTLERMPRHPFWTVAVHTNAEAEEAVTELLRTQFGGATSSYINVQTGRATVTAYLAEPPKDVYQLQRKISANVKRLKKTGLGDDKIIVRKLRHEDWAESSKRHFKPITVSAKVMIKPTWSHIRPRKEQIVVVLDPGLSFGTGHHPTTLFCLQQLVKQSKDRSAHGAQRLSFLDVGTGSGILAIAAAK